MRGDLRRFRQFQEASEVLRSSFWRSQRASGGFKAFHNMSEAFMGFQEVSKSNRVVKEGLAPESVSWVFRVFLSNFKGVTGDFLEFERG